jgi:predicted TIM-barrel fold metal-dependent hydrolase
MPRRDSDPDGLRLPVKIDATSNGEFLPRPLSGVSRLGNRMALEAARRNARRLGQSRRRFMMSLAGAASVLLAHNRAHAAAGRAGGYYALPAAAALDEDAASESLGKREFIFDVQGHFVNPQGAWLKQVPDGARPFAGMPQAQCERADAPEDLSYLQCLSGEQFVKDVFLDSDTDMMVLSFVPSLSTREPLTIEEAAAVRDIVGQLQGTKRLLLHGRVNPNQDGDLERMDELAERWGVVAWKCYTQWGPDGRGFYLDDPPGIALVEKARKLGVKRICIHKGLSFGPRSFEHSLCDDVGRIAKRYPDVSFLIYHSGFDPAVTEQAFRPGAGRHGIDSLVQSLLDNGLGPGSNVYAELGSTWRYLMRDPTQAAHALGKLLKYVGEENVLWGTDSIWYGSPQDQIQAFRAFQIAPELRERHGYPEITPEIRARVFGLNAMRPYGISAEEQRHIIAADAVARARDNYRNAPNPHYRTYGPKTRRQFMHLLDWNGGERV